jgi:putative ABC transport system permease protein
MIGLALVSFVAVLGKGVHGSIDRAVKQQLSADWVITSQNGWSQFPAAAGDAATTASGVERATSVRSDRGLIGKAQVNVNGVDRTTVAGLYHFAWRDGSSDETLRRLDGHGAVVKQAFARKHDLAIGDHFVLRASNGHPLSLRVIGVFQPPRIDELLGGIVVSTKAFDRTFPRPQNSLTLLEGHSTESELRSALVAFPDAKVQSRDAYVKNNSSFMNKLLNMVYVLLALSVAVSLFGMVNTLVLSVYERTRELGMLRAVGMSPRQARRMVRHESVITALIGAGLGLPLGAILAAGLTHALSRFGVAFAVSVPGLAAFTFVAIVAGIVAAVMPARRAARVNVLAALQYE